MIMHICKFILTLWYFEFILFMISSRSGPKPIRPQSSPVPVHPAPDDPPQFFIIIIIMFIWLFFKYIIYFRFCNIGVWREERKSWQLSIFQWNYRCEFNSVIVWWMIWCPIYNMGYMKNKQNNEFSHFFYSWHILYDNKTTNLTLQTVPKKH